MAKLLIIDLSARSYAVEPLPAEIMHDFIGGRGLGAYLLYKYLQPGVNPLDPENVLVFGAGPAQGTSTYYSSRTVMSTKSPYTGIYLYSVAGGRFGSEIRKAGYAALVIQGRASAPTYLAIRNETVQFRPADRFWGLNTVATQDSLLEDAEFGTGACVCIGPAGEQLHKMAAVMTEGAKARTFGRGGGGAVMGSKNLKGVVVAGTQEVPLADREAWQVVMKAIAESAKGKPKWLEQRKRFGSGADIMVMNELGILPTRNWSTGTFEKVKGIALTEIEHTWPRKSGSCGPYCISPCSHVAVIDRGPWKGAQSEGPEYETIYAFGMNCGVDQFDAIVAAEQICDLYGIDTMSCGATIAFAMECYAKGLITKQDTGGLELHFGNAAAMVRMVEMMARQEGFGKQLSEGSRGVAEQIAGSGDFSMQCKGLEFGGYECRGLWGQALQFALNSRGGCHHGYGLPARSPAEQEHGTQVAGKGQLVKTLAADRILYDCSILCTFAGGVVGLSNLTKLVNAITGENYNEEEISRVGLRVLNLERMFNVREGLGRQDDFLPGRLWQEPLPDGPRKGSVVPMNALLDEGYGALGWDKDTGVPRQETLEELGLNGLCRQQAPGSVFTSLVGGPGLCLQRPPDPTSP